jgi:hypothetical protein
VKRCLLLALAVTACGEVVPPSAPPAPSASVHAAASVVPGSPVPPAVGTAVGPTGIDLSRPLVHSASCGDYSAYGPPKLADILSLVKPSDQLYTAAAVMTVSSVGATLYNTPNGERWTAEWLAAGHDPLIFTSYTFTVQRPLSSGLAAGQQVVAYVPGGKINGDTDDECIGAPTIPNPRARAHAVVILGAKSAAGPPVVSVFDVMYGSAVVTPRGTEPIPG